MGIRGLTTYINNRSRYYLEHHGLHDTYLVLDGNSVACQIYVWHTKCNSAFGGDYDKYAQCISDFYDRLLKCNVTPLVIFDGGFENKKLKTLILRIKEKIRDATSYSPTSQATSKLMPLQLKIVFKDVTCQKGIKQAQCFFEADNAIAAVAKLLNCPVLSYDSDFYVFGTLYVPFNTLENYVVRQPSDNGYMVPCQIFRVENLLNSFRGLSQSTLPLAAILLGNDYVKKGTFKYFFRHMKLQKNCRRKTSRTQRRIEATFTWLSRHSINDAVILILNRVPKQFRKKLLDIIEEHVNGYEIAPPEIFGPLGLSQRDNQNSSSKRASQAFKFDGDINNLPELVGHNDRNPNDRNPNDSYDDESEDDEETDVTLADAIEESETVSTELLTYDLPQWFLDEFMKGYFPTYFMDLIMHNLYVCPIGIEEISLPATMHSVKNIISTVYKLLVTGIHKKSHSMKYITRGERSGIRYYKLTPETTLMSCSYPSLHNLNEVSKDMKEQILMHTLGITQKECLEQLPSAWKLYIAVIKYWIDEAGQRYYKLHCHFNSLLLCLFLYIVDEKIGMHRTVSRFQNKLGGLVAQLQSSRKTAVGRSHDPADMTLMQAYDELDKDDCLLAASFFISHTELNQKLIDNPKRFDRTIVHAFTEFQMCLVHCGGLNALLGFPYADYNLASLFNGTFLYNCCSNLKSRKNVKLYLNTVLQNSPTILRLFDILLEILKPLFPDMVRDTEVYHTKSKKKESRLEDICI